MKYKTGITLMLAAAAPCTYAQSSVTLYGLIDTSLRYSTHANASGSSLFQLTDGVVAGSRWV